MGNTLISDGCDASLMFKDGSTVCWTNVMLAEDEKNWYFYDTDGDHKVVAIYNKDYVVGIEFTSNCECDEADDEEE